MSILDPVIDPTDDMPLDFGKYCGKTPRQLLEADPGYVAWLHESVPSVVTRSLYLDACSILEQDDDRRYLDDEDGESA